MVSTFTPVSSVYFSSSLSKEAFVVPSPHIANVKVTSESAITGIT
jgi:hypothetical protein